MILISDLILSVFNDKIGNHNIRTTNIGDRGI